MTKTFIVKASDLKSGTFTDVADGTYGGTVVKVVDLGVQPAEVTRFGAQPAAPKLFIEIELDTDVLEGSELPPSLFVERKISFAEKANLPKDLKAILRLTTAELERLAKTGVDFFTLLGQSVLVTVGRSESDKAKVTSLSPLMKGQTVATPKRELLSFTARDPDKAVYDKLHDFLKKKIDNSLDSPVANSLADNSSEEGRSVSLGGDLDL